MAGRRVGSRSLTDRQSVVNVPPMLWGGVSRIDGERFDDIDRLQDLLDLRPTGETQQAFPAWTDERHGRVTLAGPNGAQNVDARDHRAVVVGCPANEGKDAAWRKRDNALLPIDDALLRNAAEADPVLDTLFDPSQFDMSEFIMHLLR